MAAGHRISSWALLQVSQTATRLTVTVSQVLGGLEQAQEDLLDRRRSLRGPRGVHKSTTVLEVLEVLEE